MSNDLNVEVKSSTRFRLFGEKFAASILMIWRWLISGPVSLAISIALIAVFVVAIVVGRGDFVATASAGAGHAWWTAFTAMFITPSAVHMVVDVIFMLTVGTWLERQIGWARYALVGAISYWVAVYATVGIVYLIGAIDHEWGDALKQQLILGIAGFLIAVAAAASVKMSALVRNRVRVLVLTILVVMVLFAGSVGTVFMIIAAVIGLGIGALLWTAERDRRVGVVGGPQNGRELVAIIIAGIVVGTLISLRSPQLVGVFSSMRYTVGSGGLSPEVIAQICGMEDMAAQCRHYQELARSDVLGSHFLVIMPLIAQLVLCWGLRGGRRAAWWGTVALQGLSAIVALAHLFVVWGQVRNWGDGSQELGFNEAGHPSARFIVPIVVPIAILVVMFFKANLFTVRAKPGTYTRFWRDLALVTAITLLVTLIIGVSIGATKSFLTTILVLTSDFVIRLLPSSVLSLVPPAMTEETHGAVVMMSWVTLIPWIALIVFLARSFHGRYLPSSISREEYMQIVEATQGGSMAWIATWEGNHYWRSEKHQAAVAFRADKGVALTVTDPAALEADLPEVMEEFTHFCNEQGLIPAFYSIHAPTVAVTDRWGWQRLQVAEETVLNLPDLEFKGKKFQDVRTSLNRAAKEGIVAEWTTFAECKPAYMAQIKAISQQWVSDKPLPEMGFTLGGVNELDDPEVRILLAVDGEGTVHGVTSWMPVYDEGEILGWTLDFMRRWEGGFRPVMEFLIASAALWAKDEGFEMISLSGAPLAKAKGNAAEEGSSAAILDQVLEILGKTLEPMYGFRSLLAFKSKFNPEYVPVYLAAPTLAELPAVGIAIAHAYVPNLSLRDTVRMGSSIRSK